MIDGVIVVARPNLTTREQIRRVLAILQRHPAAGVGLVLNGATEGRHMYYYPASENGSSTERSRFSRLIGSR
jgi:Mrp family chromosome partitioning ATPase